MSSAMGSEAIQKLVNVSVLSTEQSFQKDLENELFTSSVSKRIINNEGELFNSLSFFIILLNLNVLLGIFLLNKTITKMSMEDMEKSTLNITTSILEFVNKIKKLP